jgi:hypothetical protein
MLELVQPEPSTAEVKILLDEKIIKELFDKKILSKLAYIYFAIEVEKGENPNPHTLKIDKDEFTERWNLKSIADIEKALIDLHWKGAVHDSKREEIIQLSLRF